MSIGWAELKNDTFKASVLAELTNGSVIFMRGYIESVLRPDLAPIHIGPGGLKELEFYGFEYPDYVAEITEQLERDEQKEPYAFI